MVGWKTGECVDAGEGQDGSSAFAPRKMSKINKAKSTKHAMYLEEQEGYDERISFC
jgi:phosphotransferase system IIA component